MFDGVAAAQYAITTGILPARTHSQLTRKGRRGEAMATSFLADALNHPA
ncbi:Hypothetical protein ABZS17H1_01303 [Kosakonia cowanii]